MGSNPTLTARLGDRNLDTLSWTRVIVAHRLSTIRNADLIVVLEDGCIAERGRMISCSSGIAFTRRWFESDEALREAVSRARDIAHRRSPHLASATLHGRVHPGVLRRGAALRYAG